MSSNESLSSTIGIELTSAAKREHIHVGYQKLDRKWKYSILATLSILQTKSWVKMFSSHGKGENQSPNIIPLTKIKNSNNKYLYLRSDTLIWKIPSETWSKGTTLYIELFRRTVVDWTSLGLSPNRQYLSNKLIVSIGLVQKCMVHVHHLYTRNSSSFFCSLN